MTTKYLKLAQGYISGRIMKLSAGMGFLTRPLKFKTAPDDYYSIIDYLSLIVVFGYLALGVCCLDKTTPEFPSLRH